MPVRELLPVCPGTQLHADLTFLILSGSQLLQCKMI